MIKVGPQKKACLASKNNEGCEKVVANLFEEANRHVSDLYYTWSLKHMVSSTTRVLKRTWDEKRIDKNLNK